MSAGEGGGAYREILLNRPKALNALNLSMAQKILSHLQSAAADPSVAMVVMEGEGANQDTNGAEENVLVQGRIQHVMVTGGCRALFARKRAT